MYFYILLGQVPEIQVVKSNFKGDSQLIQLLADAAVHVAHEAWHDSHYEVALLEKNLGGQVATHVLVILSR